MREGLSIIQTPHKERNRNKTFSICAYNKDDSPIRQFIRRFVHSIAEEVLVLVRSLVHVLTIGSRNSLCRKSR